MKKQDKGKKIHKILDDRDPVPSKPVNHIDPYTLWVSVLLSARCTDKKVNEVTPELFSLADNPKDMSKIDVRTIRRIVKPCGLSPQKSRAISTLSKILVKEYNSKVPKNFEDLESLPGIGHKSASVVMGQAFGVQTFPVDTHIHRLAWRWGLSNRKSVEQTEKDLKRLFPEKSWNKLHLQIIFFGREYCPAISHIRDLCPICSKYGRKDMK